MKKLIIPLAQVLLDKAIKKAVKNEVEASVLKELSDLLIVTLAQQGKVYTQIKRAERVAEMDQFWAKWHLLEATRKTVD